MQPIVEVRTIAQPLTKVYAYLTDTRNLANWVPGISRLQSLAGPPTVGDSLTFTVNGFSSRMTYTALVAPSKITYEVLNLLCVLPVVVELASIDDATTRMMKLQTIQPIGLGRILGPLLKRALINQVSNEADLIKHHVEQ